MKTQLFEIKSPDGMDAAVIKGCIEDMEGRGSITNITELSNDDTYNPGFQPFGREYTYEVESYDVLDEIIQTVPCYTRESSRSQAVDLDDIGAESLEALAKILCIDSKGIPNGGIVVFYK